MALTLTAANSFFTLNIPDVFGPPQIMQGYGVDDAFEIDGVTCAQVLKGVDARKSQGFTPYNVPFKFVLQADSLSITNTMDVWIAAESQANETYRVDGQVVVPGVQKVFTLSNGTLKTIGIMPGVKKILQQQAYEIEFDTVTAGPFVQFAVAI